ncbi:SusC/RagA family TonB-linked outer membrane protein [Chitinophaga costaii]
MIGVQTGYAVFYKQDMLKQANPVSLNVTNMPLKTFLDLLFKDQPFSYQLANKTIALLTKKASTPITSTGMSCHCSEGTVSGTVISNKGQPIPSATVLVKGTRNVAKTDEQGHFYLQGIPAGARLIISCIGFQRREISVDDYPSTIIQMEAVSGELSGVTVNAGIVTRNKYTFTGATSSFTGEQLKSISNGSIIQSLKTLDPSFIQIENSKFGSNPNHMPQLEIRGKSGITTNTVNDVFKNDPNQPLFILNGMETTLQKIVDLDINRVASVTILKDAASTALYGSRAANGVVVVETKKPINGAITVSYTFDGSYTFPDLSSYNMMNAAENLEFQRLAGLFKPGSPYASLQFPLDEIYNERKIAVLEGRNYSWLNVPLRNVVSHGHNLYIDGGDEKLAFGVGLSYKNQPGVMKGSSRGTYGANIDLTYRDKKFNISNQLYVNGFNSSESPYGSFQDYVNINPYFSYLDDNGGLNKEAYLEQIQFPSSGDYRFYNISNPIYNALLNSKNQSKDFSLQDNLTLIYDIIPSLRFSAGVQISRDDQETVDYVSPANTQFDNVDVLQRGSYNKTQLISMGYQGNIMLTYNKVLAGKHSITANLRTEGQYNKATNEGFSAVGFPDVNSFNPAFSFSYQPDSRPDYSESRSARLSSLLSFNYAYNTRYFLDFTYRIDGSSSFGSNKLFTPFLSAGIGWNLNKEPFMQNWRNIDQLRIRGDIGSTGNQNLGSFVSTSVYNYTPGVNPFGLSYVLANLGNPNLDWQKTVQTSVGLDLSMFNRRLNATLNAYRKITNPLLINAALPSSSGIEQLPMNIGKLNTSGAEVNLSFSPVYKLDKNVVWTLSLTGSILRSKFADIGNRLDYQNEKLLSSQDLIRYKDGHSPDDVWAVRSLGIDPATGQELYLSRTGKYTMVYDPQDIVSLGSSQPKIQGIAGTNLRIKAFTASLNFRYSTGAYNFNQAMFNKVENISTKDLENNQDKRALYDRWQKPGDIKPFRSIAMAADGTSMSSRFVQKENYISGEAISFGYQLYDPHNRLLRSIGAKSLRFTAYMNDIFRVSNILLERGTDYPYTRSFSFSVSATF